jgi:hypothetical protein
MARNRRQVALLGILLAVLACAVIWQFWPTRAVSSTTSPTPAAAKTGARREEPAGGPPPQVRLSTLERPVPAPAQAGRDPFRLRTGAAPPALPAPAMAPPSPEDVPEATGHSPVAPVPYKFIGMVTGEGKAGRIAVLSDGKFVYYGREGDIIEGRYRLVRIGEESLQIEHLDGRGRQTLRMSGS